MKNIKNIGHPSRTCCKHSRPLPYYMQKQQDAPALEATQHHRPAQPTSNINVSAKFYQNIPNGLRVKFHYFQNLNLGKTSTNPKCHLTISWATSCQYRPMKNVISHSVGLDLVNINVYAKVYQNIPLSSRDRAIFIFSEFGARQSLDQ